MKMVELIQLNRRCANGPLAPPFFTVYREVWVP